MLSSQPCNLWQSGFVYEAKIRAMDKTASKKTQFAVIWGLPADYDNDSSREEIFIEYPRLNRKLIQKHDTKMYACHSVIQRNCQDSNTKGCTLVSAYFKLTTGFRVLPDTLNDNALTIQLQHAILSPGAPTVKKINPPTAIVPKQPNVWTVLAYTE